FSGDLKTVGEAEYKGRLGQGMFGEVVKAYSTQMKKMVAIKVTDISKCTSVYIEKFLPHEKGVLETLDHPNIVKTHEIFESPKGTVYMVMELCVKGDLLNYINSKLALPERFSHKLFSQLCRAVEYLHSRNVAHRDLKCENLFLDAKYNLKVGDFGLSKTLTYVDGRVVLSRTFCGTSLYAAPEVLHSIPYDPKVSDVWSMGVVLYMMLYGSVPFNCSNVKKQAQLQKKRRFNFPKDPPVSPEAKDLIRRILHPIVEQRPYEQHFGDSGKEKLPFNRKKPPAEPGSGRGGAICCDWLG
uniref:non-specific serine/threonine protein kinase n=1 Tax=Haplochromis burtoni TaxID=8153 RepID=A0A3Q2W639_HAPBU